LDNTKLKEDFRIFYDETLMTTKRQDLIKESTAYYQTASDMLTKKKYDVK